MMNATLGMKTVAPKSYLKCSLAFLMMSLVALEAGAGGLTAPFSLDSATLMPKGVRSLRFGGFTTEVSEKYSDQGLIVPMANSFNKPVTWGELLGSVPAGKDRGVLKGGVAGDGVSMMDVAGQSLGALSARVSVATPVLAYGLREDVTLGIGVPVIYSNFSVATGWQAADSFQNKLDQFSSEGQYERLKAFEGMLKNVVATKIASYGYEALEDEKRTDIGDITLGAKYQLFKNEDWSTALAPKIVLPTGRVADVNKVVDISSGDGQFDVGLGAVSDYRAMANLTLTSSAHYTYQAPSNKAKRIPLTTTESISPDLDPSVKEKLGDTMGVAFSAKYKIKELWTLSGGYSYQYKLADQYSGSMYSAERYSYMADETEQRMQSGTLGLTFSTIPLFQAKSFAVPLDASVTYSAVLAGRNVNKVGLTALELAAYF